MKILPAIFASVFVLPHAAQAQGAAVRRVGRVAGGVERRPEGLAAKGAAGVVVGLVLPGLAVVAAVLGDIEGDPAGEVEPGLFQGSL